MPDAATTLVQNQFMILDWANNLFITSLALSMTVNALVTGLIVFKILTVFLEVKAAMTSVERTLGSTGGTKLRHIVFVIIESGMTLFAIQLIRILFAVLPAEAVPDFSDYLIVLQQMFNVITIKICSIFYFCFTDNIYQGITPTIILVRVSMRLSFDDEESFKEAAGSLRFHNPPSDPNLNSMPPQLGLQLEGQEISHGPR